MMKYEETKEEIKSFFLKALIVVYGLAIIAIATYVCNIEKEKRIITHNELEAMRVFEDSTNLINKLLNKES